MVHLAKHTKYYPLRNYVEGNDSLYQQNTDLQMRMYRI
jgi:hypothetical protein